MCALILWRTTWTSRSMHPWQFSFWRRRPSPTMESVILRLLRRLDVAVRTRRQVGYLRRRLRRRIHGKQAEISTRSDPLPSFNSVIESGVPNLLPQIWHRPLLLGTTASVHRDPAGLDWICMLVVAGYQSIACINVRVQAVRQARNQRLCDLRHHVS